MLDVIALIVAVFFGVLAVVLKLRPQKTPPCIQVVPVPVTACPNCWQPYDLEEWRELTYVDTQEKQESRLCSCDELLTLDVAAYEQDYLTAAEYARIWPNSDRPQTRLFVFEPGKGVRSV